MNVKENPAPVAIAKSTNNATTLNLSLNVMPSPE